uniref:Glycogen [starch] synthase n=1 Tax=Ditylenchus dipsaci TaxID=166011 RepID=A0A915DED7_9BILA
MKKSVSWEVANKVGGIYTVLRTKAPVSTDELGDQYCMMGLTTRKGQIEFVIGGSAGARHSKHEIQLDQMQEWGYRVVYGRWLIDGYPKVVLFDIGSGAWKLDAWKHELWEKCNIGVPTWTKRPMTALFLVSWCACSLKL